MIYHKRFASWVTTTAISMTCLQLFFCFVKQCHFVRHLIRLTLPCCGWRGALARFACSWCSWMLESWLRRGVSLSSPKKETMMDQGCSMFCCEKDSTDVVFFFLGGSCNRHKHHDHPGWSQQVSLLSIGRKNAAQLIDLMMGFVANSPSSLSNLANLQPKLYLPRTHRGFSLFVAKHNSAFACRRFLSSWQIWLPHRCGAYLFVTWWGWDFHPESRRCCRGLINNNLDSVGRYIIDT